MNKIQIVKQLINGNHLSSKELRQADSLLNSLITELNSRFTPGNEMQQYRVKMIKLLEGLSHRADFICTNGQSGCNLEYDFDGQLPAYPDQYNKARWEEENNSMAEIVCNYILPELDRAISDMDHTYRINALKNIKSVIEDIEWSEI